MTKDVIVSVTGTQFSMENMDEPVEVITSGSYYKKNNKHYVVYDEVIDGEYPTKNMMKFDDTCFNLIRSGAVNSNMIFEENKRNLSNYVTPFGTLVIGIDASKVDIDEKSEEINVDIDYAIDVNSEYLADCKITCSIKAVQ